MEYDLIETPENVELEQRLAGIGTRFMAGLVDVIIIFGSFAIIFIAAVLIELVNTLDSLRHAIDTVWALTLLVVGFFLVIWGYFALFELYANGQTPGKKYMKIRVVKEGGGAIGFSEIAIRNLLRPIDGFPLYPVAGIVMFFTSKGQRLGDLAAGTVVISEASADYSAKADRPRKIEWTTPMSSGDLRRTRLTPEELRVLSSYERRRYELTLEARERLLRTLLPPILHRLGQSVEDDSVGALDARVDWLLGVNESDGEVIWRPEEPS